VAHWKCYLFLVVASRGNIDSGKKLPLKEKKEGDFDEAFPDLLIAGRRLLSFSSRQRYEHERTEINLCWKKGGWKFQNAVKLRKRRLRSGTYTGEEHGHCF